MEPKRDETEDADSGVIAKALLAVVGEGFIVQEGEEGKEGEATQADTEKQADAGQEEEKGTYVKRVRTHVLATCHVVQCRLVLD